jgi:uncharacterized membrane protein YkoI
VTRFVAIDCMPYDTWRMRLTLTLLFFAALALLPGNASAFELEESLKAQHSQYQPAAEYRIAQSDGMSLSQAVQSVRSRTGGQILSAETKVQGGREVHHIKVLKDGKVKTHKVNGRRR